ncbi:hypothetical protein SCHPADRAFT_823334 [Schizopora paradoxa]|uniref:G domain-containing protein n=1 Tax=Schizopora paradoxa TaxID=27342 RepID=A0A0H2S3K6_9AGAM|nr:hypothetical protein SCHPADRAFT_823334 [Schizopora paradoxa]
MLIDEKHEEQQEIVLGGIPASFKMFNSVQEIDYTPEKSLQEGLNMVKTLKAHINHLELGSKMRKDVWLKEITSLQDQGTPRTLIAVCGGTGVGKSSALNAILDDNIVPTSGMRACTAVVTEISYQKEKGISADVSFLSEKEWRDELKVLLDDLVDESGQVRRTGDLRSEAGVAWHKVHAVYPRLTQDRVVGLNVDQLINLDKKIAGLLGTVKKINAKDSKEFSKQIAKYIDSKDQKRGKDKDKKNDKADGPALWPLIRQVNVKCPAEALSTGAILVDLPGVADANAARSSIARDYMKKADCIWVLAPITRAVDDKTAKDLLGDAFKSQVMNGGFNDVEGTITFIATKCDDISCSEAIGSLSLEDDPELEDIENRLQGAHTEIKECKARKAAAEKVAKEITEELKVIREDVKEHEDHLDAIEEGREFTYKNAKKDEGKKKKNSKKRKNTRGGKGGSPKRRKSEEPNSDSDSDVERMLDSDADMDVDDEDDDFIVDDDDDISVASDKKSNHSDSDDSEKDDSDNEDDDDKKSNASNDENDGDAIEEEPAAAPLTKEDVKALITARKADLKDARERLSNARKDKKEAMDAQSAAEKRRAKIQREKNGFCSKKRSEYSRDVLKQDFRSGLKELDDADAERRNPATFDPTVNLRDYDNINLPVFTVSARDYIRITKQVKGDGEPSCFSSINDTGVPELQEWCKTLTVASRERGARSFRNHLRVFATSVKTYIQSFGTVSESDRTTLRDQWQTKQRLVQMNNDDRDSDSEDEDDPYDLGNTYRKSIEDAYGLDDDDDSNGISKRLAKDLVFVVEDCVKEMQEVFREGIEDKCKLGAEYAAENAVQLVDDFAGSTHWCTYRATLRRNGAWRRNLNEELAMPMMKNIASSWAKVFESDLLTSFEKGVVRAVKSLLEEFLDSCNVGLRERAKNQSELCIEEVKVSLKKTVGVVSEQLQASQKDVSRGLAPHVQDQLFDGYATAMLEKGTGSVARQKAIFRNFVNKEKHNLFDGGADSILERLGAMAIDVGKALVGSLEDLANKVEVNLAVLWEGPVDVKSNVTERIEAVSHVTSILQQLALWDTADTTRPKLIAPPS